MLPFLPPKKKKKKKKGDVTSGQRSHQARGVGNKAVFCGSAILRVLFFCYNTRLTFSTGPTTQPTLEWCTILSDFDKCSKRINNIILERNIEYSTYPGLKFHGKKVNPTLVLRTHRKKDQRSAAKTRSHGLLTCSQIRHVFCHMS